MSRRPGQRCEFSDDPRLAALGLVDVADVFALSGRVVSRDPRSCSLRVEAPGGALFVKTFRYTGFLARVARLFADSHCRREARNLRFMRDRGVGCPEVLGWGEERFLGAPIRAFLITAEIAGTRTLADLLEGAELEGPARSVLMRELAAQVARLHESGYLDRDLKFRNILVDAEGHPYHVDSPKGRVYPGALSVGRAAIDLGMLAKHADRHFSAGERRRFLASYARHRGLDQIARRGLARLVARRIGELHRRGARTA